MIIREVLDQEREKFDAVATHPLQSWSWGDFKKANGAGVIRLGAFDGNNLIRSFQISVHKVPHLNWMIGYYPKGAMPDEGELFAVKTAADKFGLVFVKMEPNVWDVAGQESQKLNQARAYLLSHNCELGRAQFTPNSFIIDLTKTEEELFANLKNKWRYNVRVALKHEVAVKHDNSPEAFEEYIKLWKETTSRQKFYAHDEDYQRQMWKLMSEAGIAHILRAEYQGKTLGVWIVFVFNNVLYYPYGASSRENREVMANNLLAWEAIRFGKKMNCHSFDMWGSLGLEPDKDDPWYGFHNFKQGYGGTLAEFVGTYDFVADPQKYKLFRMLDRWRWKYLRFRSKLPF